jgi:hypothetical protein
MGDFSAGAAHGERSRCQAQAAAVPRGACHAALEPGPAGKACVGARATIRDFETGRHRLHRSTETLIITALTAAGVTLLGDPVIGLGVASRRSSDRARAKGRPAWPCRLGPDVRGLDVVDFWRQGFWRASAT